MKSILLSIKPKYVSDILNGRKTIEVRKTMLKCDLPIDVYIYATKGGMLWKEDEWFACDIKDYKPSYDLSGKVIAKFTLRKIEKIYISYFATYFIYLTKSLKYDELLDKSCLSVNEVDEYLQRHNGYAWHIEDLVIFDKPKELSEFKHICPNIMCDECNYADLSFDKCLPICYNQLKRAPQSWCYVESEE